MTLPVRSIRSHELLAGMDLVFLGTVHRIVRVRPSRHPEFGGHLIAIDATGWGISVYPRDRIDILDETPQPGPPDFAEVGLGDNLASEDEEAPTRAPRVVVRAAT